MAMAMHSPYQGNERNMPYPRDASFSSYLDTAERDFVRNLAESMNSFSTNSGTSSPRVSIGRNRIPRNELGVFGAERYFNEKLVVKKSAKNGKEGSGGSNNRQRHRRTAERGDDLLERKSSKSTIGTSSSLKSPTTSLKSSTPTRSPSLKSPTPSLKSEASWNSQIGLLRKTSVGSRIFSGFQCKGSCFDKKSVYTTATTRQTTVQSRKSFQENGPRKSRLSHEQFAFPIIDTASPHHHCKNKNLQDQPRKSLEVFGLQQLGKQAIEQNLERKLSILSWDAIPNHSTNTPLPFPFPFPNTKTSNVQDHDVRSDASSDLFEIENLSGLGASQNSDISSCTTRGTTHHYEPSEASIEWSVVTASAARFSTASDDLNNDQKIAISKKIVVDSTQRNSSTNGLLLGCRNHKAVDVVRNTSLHVSIDNSHRKNSEKGRFEFDLKGSPHIAPSTSSRNSLAAGSTIRNYALTYS